MRKLFDKEGNSRGKKLIKCSEQCNLTILNGRMPEDILGQFIYHGLIKPSVIDYAICDTFHADLVFNFRVLNLTTRSNHMPLIWESNLIPEAALLKKIETRVFSIYAMGEGGQRYICSYSEAGMEKGGINDTLDKELLFKIMA